LNVTYWDSFERVADEGWIRSVARTVRGIKKSYRVKNERNTLQAIQIRKYNWIDHNCLLNYVIGIKIDGRTEMAGKWRRNFSNCWMTLNSTKGYWKLRKKELDGTVLRTGFGRGYGTVIRETKN